MKAPLIFILILPVLLSLTQRSDVSLRFTNKSSEEFKELFVNVRGQEFRFQNVKSGESTPRLKVKETYPYCYIRVITEKDTLTLQPQDYVGEKLYTSGKLTINIQIVSTGNGQRTLELESRRPAF